MVIWAIAFWYERFAFDVAHKRIRNITRRRSWQDLGYVVKWLVLSKLLQVLLPEAYLKASTCQCEWGNERSLWICIGIGGLYYRTVRVKNQLQQVL